MNKDINTTLMALVPILRMNGEKVASIEAVRDWHGSYYNADGREFMKEVAEITFDNGHRIYADIGSDSNLAACNDVLEVILDLKPRSEYIERIERDVYPKGEEHILTHHGYNVIAELDVPEINVGDMISRRAATTIPVMPKEHRHFQTNNLDDAYEQGWNDLQECIENLPPVQPKRGKWIERESGTEDKENGFETVIVCSCCDFPATTFYSEDCESRTQIRTDFCPNCGADMRKRGEAE